MASSSTMTPSTGTTRSTTLAERQWCHSDISDRYIGESIPTVNGAPRSGAHPGSREVPVLARTASPTPVHCGTVRRHTDYALARRAVLRDLRSGRLSRLEVCDAHPELLRAARYVGERAPHDCPVCSGRAVSYVSYVYGDGLRAANGRCITQ